MISFQSLYARTTGQRFPLNETKMMEQPKRPNSMASANQLIAQVQAEHIQSLGESIKKIEKRS